MGYRYQVSESFKQECKADFATDRQGKIHIVEDNIDITGENYEGKLVDFTIDDNCYVNDKFIGTTVSKKITVNILNPNNEINLENKTIKPYAGINNEYVPFSTFIIEKPENNEYEEKTSFTGYDYMIKFKTPYIDTNTYPTTIGNILKNLCNFVGLELGTTTFVNSDYVVTGNPFTNNEECTLVLSNIAQLAGGFAHIGRDDKLYIVNIGELINGLSVENAHEIQVSNLNETLIRYFKNDNGTSISDEIDGNTYYTLQKNLIYGEVNKVTLKLDDDIDGEETSISDEKSIKDNGLTEITITGNYFLTNENDRKIAIEQLWETLRYLKYLPFKIEKYYGFPYLDVGDAISIVDSKDTAYRSYIFNHSFKYNGEFSGSIETTAITKTQEQYKSTTVKEKFRKVELSVDKINGNIKAIVEKQTENEEKITQLELGLEGITATVADNKEEINEALETTKTELETQIKVSAEGVKSNVNKTLESYSTTEETNKNISNAINNIDIGGRNLVFKSDDYIETTSGTNKSYSVNAEAYNQLRNKQITMSMDIELTDVVASTSGKYKRAVAELVISFTDGTKQYCDLQYGFKSTAETLKKRISAVIQVQDKEITQVTSISVGVYLQNIGSGTAKIGRLKIELGNKATDWIPAPEDTTNAIDESATTIQTNMSSQIQQTSENILDTVGETYTKKTELEQLEINTNTKFEQTKKDFLFQFNTITKSISDLSDATTEELNTISKYIRFVDGNIVLGETGNQLTLNISNDRISFLQGSQEVAYFSNNKLYITDGEFINSLKIGNFSFIPRTNGNLSFKKTGG